MRYRVTGTWGTGDKHVEVGQVVERKPGRPQLTVCVGDNADPSAVTGTYFLEALDFDRKAISA
jgi:hypothetical protein